MTILGSSLLLLSACSDDPEPDEVNQEATDTGGAEAGAKPSGGVKDDAGPNKPGNPPASQGDAGKDSGAMTEPDSGMDSHDSGMDSHDGGMDTCGPQAPRDISSKNGTNTVPVPQGETPTLCNVHFHDPFEHAGFDPAPKTSGETGTPVCESVDIGAEVEFHWVYTNCEENAEPIKGLANCVCDREDLVLRVFAQTYVVSDSGEKPEQPEEPLVAYAGSTTGPSYDNMTCSPAKVNWHVNKETLALSKEELGKWCEENPWPDEDHPHDSRVLVTAEEDLSQIP